MHLKLYSGKEVKTWKRNNTLIPYVCRAATLPATVNRDRFPSFKAPPLSTRRVPQGGKTVRVFSLEGEPLKEYKLDHYVSGIWVMEDEGRMWALDVNSDEPLVEYKLK